MTTRTSTSKTPRGGRIVRNDVPMSRRFAVFATVGTMALAGLVAGCGGDDNSGGGGGGSSSGGGGGDKASGKVGVLLPDSKSSVRWETVDRPLLKKAFEAAGVEAIIS